MESMEIRNLKSFEDFRNKIRRWEHDGCNCKLCKDFVLNLVCSRGELDQKLPEP